MPPHTDPGAEHSFQPFTRNVASRQGDKILDYSLSFCRESLVYNFCFVVFFVVSDKANDGGS